MNFTILIVDDSAITRAVIKRTIALSGLPCATMLEAGSGRAGLKVLGEQQVDLILVDLHMPEMNGVEMTQHVLADTRLRAIPVVVVSAEPDPQTIEALKQAGVRGHLPKPFKPEALRDLITEVLGVAHA